MQEEQTSLLENPEYAAFVEKFKPKKTADDCYTPPIVYDAIAEWVEGEYKVDRKYFVRPFYPGGDYERYDYPEGCMVVDNPPFSILASIVRFYAERDIRFFLFAPALTLLIHRNDVTHIAAGCDITYHNGAHVKTSFITNMDDPECALRSAPELTAKLNELDKELRGGRRNPKYQYPNYIVTAAMVQKWSSYGINYKLLHRDARMISALDAQKVVRKSIFGDGYLLSERAAAERAAAERAAAERAVAECWQLSERELKIVQELSRSDAGMYD